MAREKKKAEARPVDEAAADFSGLGDERPIAPIAVAPPKGRAPAKPRPRKASPVLDAPLPAPHAGYIEPAPDLSAQAREVAALLESVVRQCRDAQAQLRSELEQRRGVAEEVEAFRQHAREAHEQILRDTHEARAAHQQILAEVREGAERVEREQAAAVARLTATIPETKKFVEQTRGTHENLLREFGEGTALLRRECAAAAKQVAETGRQVESLRPQIQGIQESLLYEVELAAEGAERVKQERAAVAGQLTEAGAEFAEVRRRFFEAFEQDAGKILQRLRTTGETMQDLPRRADELRERLAEAGAEVRAFEQAACAARQKRESLETETERAAERLAALRAEAAEVENRLSGLRLEATDAESRLSALRLEAAEKAPRSEPSKTAPESVPAPEPPPAPEPETRNHLGITVDHGVVVAEVVPGTPAATAGLLRGDIITAVNGFPVLSGPELRDLILEEEAGEDIVLRLTRGGLPAEARVRFEVRAEGAPEIPLGAMVESGVVVAEVAPGSPGAAAGLLHGDIITAVNGEEVFTGAQLRDIVQALAGGAVVTIRFTRAGQTHEATTRLDEVPAAP